MSKSQQFVMQVAAVLAAALLLAPVSVYAYRQLETVDAPVPAASAPGEQSDALAWTDLLAMCYQRATADDPGDLVGTWSCAGYALPGHDTTLPGLLPDPKAIHGAPKDHARAAPAAEGSAP